MVTDERAYEWAFGLFMILLIFGVLVLGGLVSYLIHMYHEHKLEDERDARRGEGKDVWPDDR